jgi:hypothetical protein
VIEATGIVVLSVPVRRAKNRSAGHALPTSPAVVAVPPLPSGKNAFDNASEKK